MVPELVRSAVVSRRRIAGGLLEWTCRAIPCTGGATTQETADGRYTLGLHPRGLTRGDRLTRGPMRVIHELSSYWGIKNSGRPHPRGHRAGSTPEEGFRASPLPGLTGGLSPHAGTKLGVFPPTGSIRGFSPTRGVRIRGLPVRGIAIVRLRRG